MDERTALSVRALLVDTWLDDEGSPSWRVLDGGNLKVLLPLHTYTALYILRPLYGLRTRLRR